MKHYFTNKIAKLVITLFIGAIIVSFALTGFETNLYMSPDVVAAVDGTEISRIEFERAVQQRTQLFEKQMGQPVKQKQMKQMMQLKI